MLPKEWRKVLCIPCPRYIEEEIPQADTAVLSGPSHAEEVGRGTAYHLCGKRPDKKAVAEYLQNLFMSPVFRVYIEPGHAWAMELGGALKNVIALAAGAADGSRLWRQYKGSTDHQRNCRDCTSWH